MIPDPNPFKFKYHCKMCGVIFEQKFDEPAWENGLSFIRPIYEDGDFDKLKDILFSLGQGISIEVLNQPFPICPLAQQYDVTGGRFHVFRVAVRG